MLRYSKERLAEERSITDIYFKAQEELDIRKELYEKFRRKLTDEELASLDDEDIKVPLERYISVMSAGYFGGKAPTYKVKAYNADKDKIIKELFNHETNDKQEIKEIEELIKHIVDYNKDGSHFLHMVLDYLVKRACYEIYYKDEKTGEITIARSDALETVAVWDYSIPKKLIGIYRIICTYMANGEYQQMIELTTADGKRYYYDTPEKRRVFGTPAYEQQFKDEPLFKENKEEKQPRMWDDDIPATAIENCDGMAIFEPVISLIRAYERCIQNSRNVFKYNDEAILKVIGYHPENPLIIQNEKGEDVINPARVKEDEYVLTSRVRYLDGNKEVNSDIAWVEKNVNDTALQNHKKTLMDIICLCSFCPNMTDLGFTQADNNAALEKKFFSLQQYIATFEGDFIEGLTRRWRIILEKFNKEKRKTYDFRDIEVKLNRNLPSDKATDITNALKVRGLLPDETVINLLNLDLDATSELAKMDLQNEENMQKNLENMAKIGQDTNGKVGDANGDMEVSRQTDAKAENDISKDKQTNSK
ncbi:sPP1 family phage portal protein [Clostridium sp. CAG:269]|nr:sPP1 family phage portal protein [Clostridium sp. CAG:269]